MSKRLLLLLQGPATLWTIPYISHVVDAQMTDWWQFPFYMTLMFWGVVSIAAFTWAITEFLTRD